MLVVCRRCDRVATKAEGYINAGFGVLWRLPIVVDGPRDEVEYSLCPDCKLKKAADDAATKVACLASAAATTAAESIKEVISQHAERLREEGLAVMREVTIALQDAAGPMT